MKIKNIITLAVPAAMLVGALAMTSCRGASSGSRSEADSVTTESKIGPGGPQLGKPGGGAAIDKSADSTLQAMIRAEVPEFRQLVYTDSATGISLKYNLFTPKHMDASRDYPLVLFMADASTPGDDYTSPLTQGYGALVWATDAWQAKNPCYVLVPQFAGVAVNDAYEHTDEVDVVIRLLKSLQDDKNIDAARLYTTGQSMGGMISMYYNVTYPDVFAASLFVDCHWDTSNFAELVKHKFTFVTAGKSGHSFPDIEAVEKAADKAGIKYEFREWSAKLPQAEQDKLAAEMLAQGAPINIINFSPKSVLPADGRGSEHMYSFDYAYKLTPVLEWLFRQSK